MISIRLILSFLLLFQSVLTERVEILMSNVTTQQEDSYLCTSYKLTDYQNYITNIEALTKAHIAHHMFAFGCEKPASLSNSWNCGNVVCQGPKTILFAWGRNAPALQLPDDVSFKVGKDTKHKFIVVNIHYLKKVKNDVSGLAMTFSNRPRRYQAGILLMVSGFIDIPPKTRKYTSDLSCKYEGKTLKVFAYRVHAHIHGEVNTAYRIRNHEWTQLAKGDPQWPQAFYPTDDTFDVKDGDALVGQCTYHNDESRHIRAGPTHNDEMCNIYLMYYTDDISDVMDVCSGNTFPQLQSIIPDDSSKRPQPPDSFNTDYLDDKSQKSSSDLVLSHHNMEGSKMHHEIGDSGKNQGYNKDFDSYKSLSYYLNQPELEDYYDEIEHGRAKSRTNFKNDDQSLYYDSNDLETALNGDNDYLSDQAQSLLLSAAFDKLNRFKNKPSPQKNKLIKHINKLLPKTISIKKYTNAEHWYNKNDFNFGQIAGVAVNQKSDSLVVFHRGSNIWTIDSFNSDYHFNSRKYNLIKENTIVTLDRNTGKVRGQSWGANMFYMPHGITIDSEGNTWVTDVARHQVLKFDKGNTEHPKLEIGVRMVPGSDQKHLCQPTDVAVLKNGDFFVADGYCNSRVVKFNKYGEYLTELSSEDEKMPSHFFVPHSLALNEKANLLCVADRENYRIQCFDLNGNNLLQIPLDEFGPIYSVSFAANNASVLYAINGYNNLKSDNQFDKKILLISTKNGKILGSINLAEDSSRPHDLDLSDDASEIYVSNLSPSYVFKYVLVNYKIGKNGKKNLVKKDNIDLDKDNFRTSMLIMAFLACPLILIGMIAFCIRLKNLGKLNKSHLGEVSRNLDAKQKKLGKWIGRATNKKKRNGFTRLNQDSDDEAETERLNAPSDSDKSESESDEIGIKMPTLAKA